MSVTLLQGDCRELLDTLEPGSVQTIITSPPYWGLRRYTNDEREIGIEPTIGEYVDSLTDVFDRCWRVLRDDGVLFLNLGDSYIGSWGNYAPTGKGGQRAKQSERWERRSYRDKADWRPPTSRPQNGLRPKNLAGIPWRVAFALQDAGWILRSDIVWAKTNPMPESVTDRPTRSHEYVFLFSKAERYFYDAAAIAEQTTPGDGGFQRRAARGLTVHHNQGYGGNGETGQAKGRGGFVGPRETRNARSVWSLATSPIPDEHYAPMPLALAERCIKAGSAAQACEVCGAPWARVMEPTGHVNRREPAHVPGNTPTKTDSTGWAPTSRATDQWRPACACPGAVGSSASVILDPFAGSGTTGRAALTLQRSAVLIDLAYTDLQERRTDGVQVQMVELLHGT